MEIIKPTWRQPIIISIPTSHADMDLQKVWFTLNWGFIPKDHALHKLKECTKDKHPLLFVTYECQQWGMAFTLFWTPLKISNYLMSLTLLLSVVGTHTNLIKKYNFNSPIVCCNLQVRPGLQTFLEIDYIRVHLRAFVVPGAVVGRHSSIN